MPKMNLLRSNGEVHGDAGKKVWSDRSVVPETRALAVTVPPSFISATPALRISVAISKPAGCADLASRPVLPRVYAHQAKGIVAVENSVRSSSDKNPRAREAAETSTIRDA